MSLDWKEWSRSDIIYGIIVPLAVVLAIVGLSLVSSSLMRSGGMSGSSGFIIGIISTIEELVITVAVPLLLGLVWNRWAGGASGFLLGSLYALYYSDQLYAAQGRGDISLLGNLVSAMLIGYIAGALNKRSDNYRRMLIAGGTSGIMGSLLVLLVGQFSPIVGQATVGGVVLVFLPRILSGILVPLIARAFLRHRK